MAVLQRAAARRDHVGVARRLVEVDVQADHQLQPVQRRRDACAVRRRKHRVAGQLISALTCQAGGFDLLGRAAHRQFQPEDFGRAARPAAPAAVETPRPAPGRPIVLLAKAAAFAEHRAAGFVQVAGGRVEHRPPATTPVCRGPACRCRCGRRPRRVRPRPDSVPGGGSCRRRWLALPPRSGAKEPRLPGASTRPRAAPPGPAAPAFIEQRARHRGEQERVGAGADGQSARQAVPAISGAPLGRSRSAAAAPLSISPRRSGADPRAAGCWPRRIPRRSPASHCGPRF